jgi:hypothetical protein
MPVSNELIEQIAVGGMYLDAVEIGGLGVPGRRSYCATMYGISSIFSARGRMNGTSSPSPRSFSMKALPSDMTAEGATGSMLAPDGKCARHARAD